MYSIRKVKVFYHDNEVRENLLKTAWGEEEVNLFMNCKLVTVNIVTRDDSEDIGSFRGELLERLQEKREGSWEKWETEVSKLEGGWRAWRWWPGRPFAGTVGLGAHCPAHRRLGLSKAVRSRWAGYLNTTDSQHWQHCSGVSHNWIFLDPIGSLASSVYIISNVQCVMCNM